MNAIFYIRSMKILGMLSFPKGMNQIDFNCHGQVDEKVMHGLWIMAHEQIISMPQTIFYKKVKHGNTGFILVLRGWSLTSRLF